MMNMLPKYKLLVALSLVLASLSLLPAGAFAQTSNVAPRITQAIDETSLVTISSSVHPLAQAKYDRGPVADSQPIHRGLLLLQRSPEQEAALRQLMDGQQSKSSPNYHQWLTPQQMGQLYGPAQADIQTVSSWLSSHGFQVNRVSASGTIIEFTGTAGEVQSAFHTAIHTYEVNGGTHFANSSPVKIPAALAPVVAGVVSLHNFPKKPMSHAVGVFSKSKTTGEVKALARFGPTPAGHFPTPDFTFAFNGCSESNNVDTSNTCHALGPADFNTIYSVPAGADGTNQSIAIVGDSEICTANSPDFNTQFVGPFGNTVTCSSDDVATFRSLFGLPANSPNVILDGPDPGFNSDETEGDLDVEWSGAIAPKATINFVIAESTEATAGIDLAAEYIVDNNVAPVLSESFGGCEAAVINQFYSELWEQAAAQGITVVISSGDSGSAACDDENTEFTAAFGLAVSGIASTPFNVAVGATDFNYTVAGYPGNFWSTTNTAMTQASALGPIPETPWNDSCAQSLSTVACSTLSAESNPVSSSLNIVAGGGGQSNCLSFKTQDQNGTIVCQTPTFASNTVLGYPKPSWQPVATANGLTMVTDVTRDVPDVALFGADGLVSASFYIVCEQDLDANDAPCSLSTQEPFATFIGVGGTSSSTPAFAAIMALVNQKLAGLGIPAGQGNADYVLYPLAVSHPNSFNDVTVGNNSVPCASTAAGAAPDCSVNSGTGNLVDAPSTTTAWSAGAGYDLATGLGSINVGNLLTNWATAAGSFTPTATTLCMSTTSTANVSCAGPIMGITHGTKVFVNVGVTPSPGTSEFTQAEDVALIGTFSTGTPGCSVPGCTTSGVDRFAVQLNPNSATVGEPVNADIYPLTNGTLTGTSTTFLPGGTYTVVAHYPGDGKFGASESAPISVTINPEASTAAVTVGSVNEVLQAVSTLSASPAAVPYGVLNLVRVDVTGNKSGEETATGSVTITDSIAGGLVGPTGKPASSFTLNSEGYLEDQTAFLAVGSHKFAAQYTGTSGSGDGSYSASSTSAMVPLSVTQCPTQTVIFTASPITVAAGTMVTIMAGTTSFTANNTFGGSVGANMTGSLTFTGTTGVAVAPPAGRPASPTWPVWLLALALSLILLTLLVLFPTRRRWGYAVTTLLLAGIIGTSVSCGGGSGNGGGGGGGGTQLNMSVTPTPAVDQEDQIDFVAGTGSITFTPSHSGTVTVSFSNDPNYANSTSNSIQINVQ
jgi:Pro-kumamolisin, activation domain